MTIEINRSILRKLPVTRASRSERVFWALVDVKYDRTHSAYWYEVDKADQFDPQETALQVQIGVCTNADNSRTMKKEGFSYEYHYKTKEGLALTDFKITTCE
jgi:hypothetical protein